MVNGYLLMKDLPLKETVTSTGIIIPSVAYQRVAQICAVGENSKFKVGDVIVKPIGKSTPVTINDINYECIKESYVFAKL